jgi:O-antigen/teichoic acid export membrane protein
MAADERTLVEAVDAVVVPPDPAPLARQTLAYGLSGLIVPLVGMITLPIFARAFTQGQYGTIELSTTTMTVALTLTDAGLMAATLRSFYDYRDQQEDERRTVLTTGIVSTTLLAIFVAAVLILFRNEISHWLFGRDEGMLIVVIAGSMLALNTWRFISEVMRVRLMAYRYLTMVVIAATVTTTIGVTGVVAWDWRVKGVFFAAVIGNSVAAAYGLIAIRHVLVGRFSTDELRRMLSFGLPLVPAALAAWALALVDRLILSNVGSLSQVGQYAIANRVSSLLSVGMTAFLFALTPFLLSIYSDDPEQERAARGRTLTYLTFILSLGGLVLTLFAKEALDVLAPRFGDAYKAVGPLVLGMIFYGLASVLATGLSLARTTGRGAILTVLAAAINIGLNFALIPSYGIVGAGVATAVGYGFLAVSYYVAAQGVYRTRYEPQKVITTLVLGSVLGVLGVVPLGSSAVALLVKLAAIVAFMVAVRVTGTITGAEFSELRKFARAMFPFPLGRARA